MVKRLFLLDPTSNDPLRASQSQFHNTLYHSLGNATTSQCMILFSLGRLTLTALKCVIHVKVQSLHIKTSHGMSLSDVKRYSNEPFRCGTLFYHPLGYIKVRASKP